MLMLPNSQSEWNGPVATSNLRFGQSPRLARLTGRWNMVKYGEIREAWTPALPPLRNIPNIQIQWIFDSLWPMSATWAVVWKANKSNQVTGRISTYFYAFFYVWETSKLCWGKHHGALAAWFTKQWTLACTLAGSRCLQHSPTRAAAIVRTCQDLNHSSQSDGVGLGPYTASLQVSPGTWLTMVNMATTWRSRMDQSFSKDLHETQACESRDDMQEIALR